MALLAASLNRCPSEVLTALQAGTALFEDLVPHPSVLLLSPPSPLQRVTIVRPVPPPFQMQTSSFAALGTQQKGPFAWCHTELCWNPHVLGHLGAIDSSLVPVSLSFLICSRGLIAGPPSQDLMG